MCHQAVDELSGGSRLSHGKAWSDWMRKCGLTPSAAVYSLVFDKIKKGTNEYVDKIGELIEFNSALKFIKKKMKNEKQDQ